MAKLIKQIILEDGDKYELFQTGNSYKAIICQLGMTDTKRHGDLAKVVKSRQYKYFIKMQALED